MPYDINNGLKLTGFYRGIVKAHSDNGRCKIFWPGVNPSDWQDDAEKIQMLPDAEQASPLFASSNKDDGVFFYPNIGTTVWGFFENGDINYPIYFAATLGIGANDKIYANVSSDKIEKVKENDAYRTALINLGSVKIKINGADSSLEIISEQSTDDAGALGGKATSSISFNKNGIEIKTNKNISLEARSINLNTSQRIEASCSQDITVVSGGLDDKGKRLPGKINLFGNSINVLAKGGGVAIFGTENGTIYY